MLVSICLLVAYVGQAQIFTVPNPSTTLIKNTNQSPAHWYIEIVSNIQVDTSLRWIAHFDHIPAAWGINFDDGTTAHPVVNDLDSADFILAPTTQFPLKLIIGAMLNNTPGNGVVSFDIFDPDNRTEMQTIFYEFIVTTESAGLENNAVSDWYSLNGKTAKLLNENGIILLYDELGRQIETSKNFLDLEPYKGVYLLEFRQGEKSAIIRVLL